MRYPHVKQHDEKDCGAACLLMICEYYGLKLSIAKCRELIKVDNQGANIYGIVTGAADVGLNADALKGDMNELLEGLENKEITFPFIARIVTEELFEHYVVVYSIKNGKIIIGNPSEERITSISEETFKKQWQGQIITFSKNEKFEKKNERKGSFKKFFKYITNQKKMLAFVFIMSLIVSGINLFGTVIFQYIIDDVMVLGEESGESLFCSDENCTKEHDSEHNHITSTQSENILDKVENKLTVIFSNLDTVCISIIGLYVLRCIFQVLRGYLLAITSKKIDIPLTMNYYNHLTQLPAEFFDTRKTGELMSRFQNTSEIRDAVSSATLTIMLDSLMAVVCGVFLFMTSHELFYITLITMVIYAAILFIFKKPIKDINHEIMEQDAQVTSYLKESIDGIETIKAFNLEDGAQKKTLSLFEGLVNRYVKGNTIYCVQDSLVNLTASVGTVILLWAGTYYCLNSTLSIGTLITFYYMVSYFLDPVKNLINLQPELQTAIVAAERLNDILESAVETDENRKEISDLKCDIKIDNLDFKYGNRELVLKNINMNIKHGQRIAIVGESGCGKTTLAKLLMGLYQPEKGSISFGENNLDDISLKSLRSHISYISQDIFLFSDTVENNLKLGNQKADHEMLEKVSRECLADEFICNMPMGYHTLLHEGGENLSGGQKQRLALARSVLKQPDILIMDEATSNLDTITENSIEETISALSENVTCIIIAHRLKTIKNCDYIYVMDKGEIVEEGTHDELIGNNGLYSKYWSV